MGDEERQRTWRVKSAARSSPPDLRPYPPRPQRPGFAEPSIDWRVRLAVGLLGARRVLEKVARRRMELSGLTWDEIAPILARIRTVGGWARQWRREAEASEAQGDFRRAASKAFLGHLILSPHNPEKAVLLDILRRCHVRDRQGQPHFRFERVALADGRLAGYWEVPNEAAKPPIVLMPPLASTKEELTLLGDPLLAAGHPVLRLDMPGQGESPPPLVPDAEKLLIRGMDEMGFTSETGYFAGGISLGAYFALRLAGADRTRVRGAFGVSPPAIITPEQWARQEEVIWQYLDLYFATETREQTYRTGLSMTLDDVVSDVTCPVLLYHATVDPISLPDVAERYRAALSHAPLTDKMVKDWHGCILHLKDPIAPEIIAWCEEIMSGRNSSPPRRTEP